MNSTKIEEGALLVQSQPQLHIVQISDENIPQSKVSTPKSATVVIPGV
jgi:hypothetical protein